MLTKLSASTVVSTFSTVKMIFTIKIVILASLTSATEKESGYLLMIWSLETSISGSRENRSKIPVLDEILCYFD